MLISLPKLRESRRSTMPSEISVEIDPLDLVGLLKQPWKGNMIEKGGEISIEFRDMRW
jgi:hypothetical protein